MKPTNDWKVVYNIKTRNEGTTTQLTLEIPYDCLYPVKYWTSAPLTLTVMFIVIRVQYGLSIYLGLHNNNNKRQNIYQFAGQSWSGFMPLMSCIMYF